MVALNPFWWYTSPSALIFGEYYSYNNIIPRSLMLYDANL